MITKGRLIALGTCAALGAALAVPSLVGADAPVPLAFNSYAVSGYKVSPNGKQPNSLVPTQKNGKLPARVVDLSVVQPGESIHGIIGTMWYAPYSKVSPATGFADGCSVRTGVAATGWQPCAGAAASFPLALPKRLASTNYGIVGGAVEDPECDGSFEKPTAPPGHLCIYSGHEAGFYSAGEAELLNVAKNGEGNWDVTAYVASGLAGRYGFRIEVKALGGGIAKYYASWAYTAPTNAPAAS